MTRSDEFKQGYINCISDYRGNGIEYCKKQAKEMAPEEDLTKGYEWALLSLDKASLRIYTKRRTASYL